MKIKGMILSLVRLLICLLMLAIGTAAFAAVVTDGGEATFKSRYEAENGRIQGLETKVVDDALASGGKKVGWINIAGKDQVIFTVDVPTSGYYLIVEGYDNGHTAAAKHRLVINGSSRFTVRLPKTGSWSSYAAAKGVKVFLNAGANQVVVMADTNYAELDYIEVYPAADQSPADSDQGVLLKEWSNEFQSELDDLGSGLADLQSQINRVSFFGLTRVEYNTRQDGTGGGGLIDWHSDWLDRYIFFQLGTNVKITDSWIASALFEANFGMFDNMNETYADPYMALCYLQGPIGKGILTAGRFGNYLGHGLIYDNNTTGAKYSFGNTVKTMVFSGRAVDRGTTDMIGTELRYAVNPSTNLALVAVKGDRDGADAETWYDSDGNEITTPYQYDWGEFGSWGYYDAAARTSIELSADTKISRNFTLTAGYGQSDADDWNQAYMLRLDYKGANSTVVNTYGIWAKYARVESYSTIKPGGDMLPNEKGIMVGFGYTLFKNAVLTAWYFDGEHMAYASGYTGKTNSRRSCTQIEFYF